MYIYLTLMIRWRLRSIILLVKSSTSNLVNLFRRCSCSILKFCPPEGATAPQIVWELPNFEAIEKCDFTNALSLGTMGTDPATGCFEYVFEEDHELTEYYFASKEGCAEGQKIAVKIQDFALTADQCEVIGLTTPRIRNCDCTLQKTPSALGEPCRTAFVNSCLSVVLEGECCGTGTCLSKLEDFSHAEGKAKELNRRLQCDDSMPGLCYNEDGKGTDTNGQGSKNCCTHTCSVCGTELSPFASWKPCTSLDGEGKTGKCGFLSRYDSEPYECDFSLCGSSDYWNPAAKPFRLAVGLETASEPSNNDNPNKPTDQTSAGKMNEAYAPVVILTILLSSLLLGGPF